MMASFLASILSFAAPSAPESAPSFVDRKGATRRTPRIEPIVGVTSKLMLQSLVLEQNGDTHRDRSLLWKPFGLSVGAQLYYRPGHSFATGGLRGDLSAGTELLTHAGSFTLSVTHTTGYEWRVHPRFRVFLGGRVTFAWAPADPELSHAEIGVPLGFSWRRVELQWTPAMSIPLAFDRRSVYGGELRRGVDVNFMPLNVGLVVKLGRHPIMAASKRGDDPSLRGRLPMARDRVGAVSARRTKSM